MKAIFLAVLIFPVAVTVSASPGSKNLELLNDSNGSPYLGVQYAVGADKFVAINFSVLGSQLVGNTQDTIAPSKWAIVDKKTGNQLTGWADTNLGNAYITPDSTQAFSLSISNPQAVMTVARALKTVEVAISLKESKIVYLDLQELCKMHPEKFVNLDTFATGCE